MSYLSLLSREKIYAQNLKQNFKLFFLSNIFFEFNTVLNMLTELRFIFDFMIVRPQQPQQFNLDKKLKYY